MRISHQAHKDHKDVPLLLSSFVMQHSSLAKELTAYLG
jgi:hypothetical protein